MRRSTSTLCAAAVLLGCGGQLRIDASARDGEFTTAEGEDRIGLRARLPFGWRSAVVTWEVSRGAGDAWTAVSVDSGPRTEFVVRSPSGTARYRGRHEGSAEARSTRLERQRLRYRIVAVARRGDRELRSDTLALAQNLIAAVRQEYLDIGLRRGAAPRAWFREVAQLPPGLAYGDFDVAAMNPDFLERLGRLERIWKRDYALQWQLNSVFRNPVHNRFHIGGGSGSGPVSNSWHQFGCAVDLQTFPVLRSGRSPRADTLRARAFWDALAEEALELGFEVEPRDKNPNRPGASYSGVGHVHLEVDCIS